MRPKTVIIIPSAADRNGVASSATPNKSAFTLNGALVASSIATLSPPAHVTYFSTADETGATATITGTNRYGATLTEEIAAPTASSATVKGSKNFATVTAVAIAHTASGTVEIGSADEFETAWVPVEYNLQNTRVHVQEGSTADMDYSVQFTLQNPWKSGFDESSADPQDGDPTSPVRAVRSKIENFVAGQVEMTILQSNNL